MSQGPDELALDRLRALARANVVSVWDGESFRGSGFLVSDDRVVTCAHVVAGTAAVMLRLGQRAVPAEVVTIAGAPAGTDGIHGYPDLAVLRPAASLSPLDGPPLGVWLGEGPPGQGSRVGVFGHSDQTLGHGVEPDTLHLAVAGHSGDYVRLQWDQVIPGFSGAPVLDMVTGRVCGVLKASRKVKEMAGGWLIPVDALASCAPALLEGNHRAHRPGTEWFDVARGRAAFQQRLFGPDRHPRFGPRAATAGARLAPARRPFRSSGSSSGAAATPAQMLAEGAMPFLPRAELADLLQWCRDPADHLLRLLHAPGGSGKTRLAAELCRLLRGEGGWLGGFVRKGDFEQEGTAEAVVRACGDALEAGFPVLMVFDYAQARQGDLTRLFRHLDRTAQGGKLRVLLLARSEEPLLTSLRQRMEGDGMPWVLVGATSRRLSAGTELLKTPEELALLAFEEFARQLGCPWLEAPVTLATAAQCQDSVLGVLATSLDAVLTLRQGEVWTEADPLDRICTHEVEGWYALLRDQFGGHPALEGQAARPLAEALLLAPTLAADRAPGRLVRLLTRVQEVARPGQMPLDAGVVFACLRMLYARPEGGAAPLTPDRVAEILVRRVLRDRRSCGDPDAYVRVVLSNGHLPRTGERIVAAKATLEVFARARGCTGVGKVPDDPAHPVLDRALAVALRADPEVLAPAMTAVGGELPYAEPLARILLPLVETCPVPVLEHVEGSLPGHPSGLSPVAVAVLERLVRQPRTEAEDTEEAQAVRLRRLTALSLRLAETGEADSAVTAVRNAVQLSGDLVRRSPRHRAARAAALNNAAALLSRAGNPVDAARYAAEAVEQYHRLDDVGGHHLVSTAAALCTLASLRLRLEEVAGAWADAQNGLELCGRAAPGVRQQDVRLACYRILAQCLHRVGRNTEAVGREEDAVRLLRQLADRQPGRYLAALPDVLYQHASGLVAVGRDRDAYLVAREAVLRRTSASPGEPVRWPPLTASLQLLFRLAETLPEFGAERALWSRMIEESEQNAYETIEDSRA